MQNNFSVLIPDGESGFAVFVAHCLSNFENVSIHVLSNKPWSPSRFSRYCQSYTHRQHNFDNSYLEAIRDVVKKHNISVLLPTDTRAISFTIANKNELCEFVAVVPLPDLQTYDLANNKWLMAQFLNANNIATPPSLLVEHTDAFLKKLHEIEFPVLLKPTTSRGGEGIERFDQLIDLTDYLSQGRAGELYGKYILQSWLPGNDVSLNVLSRNGKIQALTVQKGIIPNTQRFGGPGALQFIRNDRFAFVAEKLVSALSWSGYACVDTLCDNQENLHILDMNARFWASVRGSWVAGVSFPYLACQAALGRSFEMPIFHPIRFFHAKTFIRESISSLFTQSNAKKPTYSETDLNFLFSDPLAETMRVFNQEFLNI
jgi:predicted ATP-grasp superfamily ATP-dependent carboligase